MASKLNVNLHDPLTQKMKANHPNFKSRFTHLIKFSFVFLFFFSKHVSAQLAFDTYDSIQVKINGNYIANAWAGGINYAQFSALDLNLDGTKDLVVFDRTGNKIMPFINHGTPNQVDYKYAPEYISKFPFLHDWALFVDYNCDGFEDIFSYSTGGFSVFTNTSTPFGGLSFQLTKYILKSHYSAAPSDYLGLYISRVDIPAIVDVDFDGDLDVLTFDINSGTEIEYHHNMSMETYGVCDSLNNFRKENFCWGHFVANTTNTVTLNTLCKPAPGGGGYDTSKIDKTLHVGSTELGIDMDNDRDIDLLIGGVSTNDLNLLTNGGDSSNAHIIAQENNFPLANTPVNITVFPAAYCLDVDNDGRKDLIAAPNAGNASENFSGNWFYKNTNTSGAYTFSFQQNAFLQDQMIETGEGAYPTFFDYNSDGLKDLIIGNFGYFNVGGPLTSKLALYKNIGSSNAPQFELITRDYAGLAALNLSNVFATFGDVDGDGDADMLVATNNTAGSILYFENLAGAGNTANFSLNNASLLNSLGSFPAPQLVDVDRDNKLDLLIGLRNGTLSYYKNNSVGGNVVFNLVAANFGNVNVNAYGAFVGYCTPQLVDEAGVYHLYSGNQDGHIYHYDHIDNNLSGSFTLRDTLFQGVAEGDRAALAISDINADGYYDWLIGNYSGGVRFFKGKFSTVGISGIEIQNSELLLYPNPIHNILNLKIVNPLPDLNKKIEIYNTLGALVFSQNSTGNNFTIQTKNWNSGIYYCKVICQNKTSCKKFIVE